MRKVDLAWAAGFLEGEGSFIWYRVLDRSRKKKYFYFRISAPQVNLESLEKLKQIIGGTISGPYSGPNKNSKPFFNWRISGKKAEKVFQKLLPFLSTVRRRQGNLALKTIQGEK